MYLYKSNAHHQSSTWMGLIEGVNRYDFGINCKTIWTTVTEPETPQTLLWTDTV